jgi:hypothetical protein
MAGVVRVDDRLAAIVTLLKEGPEEFLFINLLSSEQAAEPAGTSSIRTYEEDERRCSLVQEFVYKINLAVWLDRPPTPPPRRAFLRPGAAIVVGALLWIAAMSASLVSISFATPIAMLGGIIAIASGAVRWQMLSIASQGIRPDALPPLASMFFGVRIMLALVVLSLALGALWPFGLGLRALLALAGAALLLFAFRDLAFAVRTIRHGRRA